jgi:hypothetical protein
MKWFLAGGLLGLVLSGQAMAQQTISSPLRQPTSVQPAAFASEDYVTFAQETSGGTATESPSNKPSTAQGAEQSQVAVRQGTCCDTSCCAGTSCEGRCECEAFKLFDGPWLKCEGIDIRGWVDAGYTWNPDYPGRKFNGPVGYNDRANEAELNQLYFIMEKVTKTDGCGWDIGGRCDLLYGTDRRFPQVAQGTEWDSEWNNNRFYGLVMPQMYCDVARNDTVFRFGHFLAPCGYESVMAPENFFYSHSYGFLYGQPTTLTGGMAIQKINDQLSVNCGMDNGWNDWNNPTDNPGVLGGFNWTSCDQRRTLAFESFIGQQEVSPGINGNRTHACLVFTQKIGCNWRYALETNYGYQDHAVVVRRGRAHGDWFGVANYLFYDINDCWSFGMRYEWFNDGDGVVVSAVGPPSTSPALSDYSALSFGLNYKPNKNVVVRTEMRYDHSTAPVFENFTTQDQFLWATDLIVRF